MREAKVESAAGICSTRVQADEEKPSMRHNQESSVLGQVARPKTDLSAAHAAEVQASRRENGQIGENQRNMPAVATRGLLSPPPRPGLQHYAAVQRPVQRTGKRVGSLWRKRRVHYGRQPTAKDSRPLSVLTRWPIAA